MIEHIIDRVSSVVAQPDELRERTLHYAEVAQSRMSEVRESVEAYTIRQPMRALGIAFGLGAIVGWMIRRR